MKKIILALTLLILGANLWAQATFKAGWNSYTAVAIIHQYTYNILEKDSIRLSLQDSSNTFVAADSAVTMTVDYHPKNTSKTVCYFSPQKLLAKCEEYTGDNLQTVNEYKYDDKNRMIYHYEDNKASGATCKMTYEYKTDKKTGELEVTESLYRNGRIEFYTRTFYNKQNVKYKEIRLNDNNKDIVHIESFFYGENGKLKERSIYFPEWKVTKTFPEIPGTLPIKCYNTFPIPATDIVNLNNRIYYTRKLLTKNQPLLHDNDCSEFLYKFTNKTTCDIELFPTKVNHGRQVVFRYKQKLS